MHNEPPHYPTSYPQIIDHQPTNVYFSPWPRRLKTAAIMAAIFLATATISALGDITPRPYETHINRSS